MEGLGAVMVLSDEERRERAYAARSPASADERDRRRARRAERATDPAAPVKGAYKGRKVAGLQDTPWYVELRTEHPTETECWVWNRPKQVTAIASERLKHPDLPLTVSVRPYLRTVLMGEPYSSAGLAARPSCASRKCVNPWHMELARTARNGTSGSEVTAAPRKPSSERPMDWYYLSALAHYAWAAANGRDLADVGLSPVIPAHVRRATNAANMLVAYGDLSLGDTLDHAGVAEILVEAGFSIRTDNLVTAFLAKLRSATPVGLRVSLGLG